MEKNKKSQKDLAQALESANTVAIKIEDSKKDKKK